MSCGLTVSYWKIRKNDSTSTDLKRSLTPLPFTSRYAIGDAADIDGQSLPTLAEVALQKGEYLTKELNKAPTRDIERFAYRPGASVAYLGSRDGIMKSDSEFVGETAWIAWRSGSLRWTRSWRRKLLIIISWLFMWFNGRDIARL